jgi:hypothetical protein
MKKLRTYAEQHGITYRTAYNHFKRGLITGAYQLETGTITKYSGLAKDATMSRQTTDLRSQGIKPMPGLLIASVPGFPQGRWYSNSAKRASAILQNVPGRLRWAHVPGPVWALGGAATKKAGADGVASALRKVLASPLFQRAAMAGGAYAVQPYAESGVADRFGDTRVGPTSTRLLTALTAGMVGPSARKPPLRHLQLRGFWPPPRFSGV